MVLIRNRLSILMGNLTTPSCPLDFKILANSTQPSPLLVAVACQVPKVTATLVETGFTLRMRIGIHTILYLEIKVLCAHLRRGLILQMSFWKISFIMQ